MKTKFLKNTSCLVAIMLLSFSSCNAHINSNTIQSIMADSICLINDTESNLSDMVRLHSDTTQFICLINDSIKNIIKDSKTFLCELKNENTKDTLAVDVIKKVPRKLSNILQYILLDPDNYKSNDLVYGFFIPCVSYKLSLSRKKFINIEIDFGLKKMRVLDSNNNLLITTDVKENNLQLLRFSRILFPEDKSLKIIENNLKSL